MYRELNLTWAEKIPSDNKIVSGEWWAKDVTNNVLVSVKVKLVQALGIKLEDKLSFQIGEKIITAKVASLRSLEWSSFHPNFYMFFSPGVLNDMPVTYMTSFHLQSNKCVENNR